jgi:hypothetical protein
VNNDKSIIFLLFFFEVEEMSNYDDLRKMKVTRWEGKVKNREEWRLIVQEAKAHPEL